MFLLDQIANIGALKGEDPRLNSREIIFEVLQPI